MQAPLQVCRRCRAAPLRLPPPDGAHAAAGGAAAQSLHPLDSNQGPRMAKGGDKARVAQNAAHLRKLQLLIAGANVSADPIVIRLWRAAPAPASRFRLPARELRLAWACLDDHAPSRVPCRHRPMGAPIIRRPRHRRRSLRRYRHASLPSRFLLLQVAFVLVRLLWRGATAGKALYAGLALTTVLYAACYRSISGALCE